MLYNIRFDQLSIYKPVKQSCWLWAFHNGDIYEWSFGIEDQYIDKYYYWNSPWIEHTQEAT